MIKYPVPQGHKRAHKATGATTPLSIAVSESTEHGIIAAGMPLDIPWSQPISFNAQFDPDLARSDLREIEWNRWLIQRLGEMVSGVALHRFNEEPAKAWQAVPLREGTGTGNWTGKHFSELIERVHERLRSKVSLSIGNGKVPLSGISYTSANIARILSASDQRRLAPEKVPLPKKFCDTKGRWRQVLDVLDQSLRFEINDALELLDLSDEELGTRSVYWFAKLADVAISIGEEDNITARRSVIAEDGSRHSPKGDTLLVRETEENSISAHLGLERLVALDYFTERTSERVKTWLEKISSKSASENPAAVLEALSRRRESEPLHLDDRSLVLLREALQKVSAVNRQSHAAAVGEVTSVDGFKFSQGKRIKCAVRPSSAYLPTSIAKDTGGWALAAKSTEGLFWIDPRYTAVLRSKRAKQFSARRFFLLLGAKARPRLVHQTEKTFSYFHSGIPRAQRDALAALENGYAVKQLQSDYISPDLEKVVADIVKQRVDEKRRKRSRALFETLERDWEELSEYSEADANFFYYTWRHAGRIPSTWIARLASEPWLSSKAKTKVAPRDIAIESAATRLTRGKKPKEFVAELDESDSVSPIVDTLEIKGSPPASELVSELKALKSKFERKAKVDDVRPLYQALAALVENERSETIGDVPTSDLRSTFENENLLLTDLGWFPPSKVFRGRAIFRWKRAFVADHRGLTRLWQLLKILPPNLKDCLSVIEEVAAENKEPTGDIRGLMVDVLRAMGDKLGESKGRLASRVAKLPLWTSQGWKADRPVYAVLDAKLDDALGDKVPLWRPLCALKSLGDLSSALNVELLTEADFTLILDHNIQPADEIVHRHFKAAIARLKSEIAYKDQELWSTTSWAKLEMIELLQADLLNTEIKVGRKKIVVPQMLFIEAKQRLYYTNYDSLGDPDIGERILARFISGDTPERMGYLWSYTWRQAEERGAPAEVLELAQDINDGEDDTLRQLETGGKNVTGKRLFAGGALGKNQRNQKNKHQQRPKPRQLKTFDDALLVKVRIVEANRETLTLKHKKRPLIADPMQSTPPEQKHSSLAQAKEWSELEKERIGFEILAAAIKSLDNAVLEDFSALRGIGADSIDNLKRFFELKVFAGDATDEVRFEPSEFERAVKAGKKYFLAVISGLEEGKDTKIRIFADPVRTLPWRKHSRIRLGGILSQSSRSLLLDIATPEEND